MMTSTDCIRTYTWDKKLESWIKDRGKNKPTITSPKDYRNRFRVSMMQYVLQAPNVWHGFLNQVPNSAHALTGTTGRQASLGDGTGTVHGAGVGWAGDGTVRSSRQSVGGSNEMGILQGALGRGFPGAFEDGGTGIEGTGVFDHADHHQQVLQDGDGNDEDAAAAAMAPPGGDGHLLNEATIREMSTMTFA